jgi:hypothetical protein
MPSADLPAIVDQGGPGGPHRGGQWRRGETVEGAQSEQQDALRRRGGREQQERGHLDQHRREHDPRLPLSVDQPSQQRCAHAAGDRRGGDREARHGVVAASAAHEQKQR